MIDLKKYKAPFKKVDLGEDHVYIRKVSASDFIKVMDIENETKMALELIKCSLCDEKGAGIDYSVEDVGKLSIDSIQLLAEECMNYSSPAEKKS